MFAVRVVTLRPLMRPSIRVAPAMVALVLALWACGGGDDGGTAEPALPPEPAPVTPEPAEPVEPSAVLTECPTTDVSGDLELTAACSVGSNVLVDGNVTIEGAALTVIGTINGNIVQTGDGGVVVRPQGIVMGNVAEENAGAVRIEGGEVAGNVTESGRGAIILETESSVESSVSEAGRGNVRVRSGSVIGAGVSEGGKGNCQISEDASVGGLRTDGCAE